MLSSEKWKTVVPSSIKWKGVTKVLRSIQEAKKSKEPTPKKIPVSETSTIHKVRKNDNIPIHDSHITFEMDEEEIETTSTLKLKAS